MITGQYRIRLTECRYKEAFEKITGTDELNVMFDCPLKMYMNGNAEPITGYMVDMEAFTPVEYERFLGVLAGEMQMSREDVDALLTVQGFMIAADECQLLSDEYDHLYRKEDHD